MGMCEEMHTTGKKFKLCVTINNDNYIDNNERNEIQTKSWNQCKIWKMKSNTVIKYFYHDHI